MRRRQHRLLKVQYIIRVQYRHPQGGITPVYVPVRFCLQSGDDSPPVKHGPPFAVSHHHKHARLPAATACIHRAHRFRYNERSTQDVTAGRELADSLKYIGNMGSKYEDMGKTPRCVIMSSRGCVHVAKTSWLQRRAARFHNNLMLHKLYCAAGRFCGTWYGMYFFFVV